MSKGIPENRIIAKGYGETMPVSSNSTDEGRQQNRRVEFKILKK
jgi:outer membrane protein OmpA-like peptidoglycan-associated protein